MPGEAGVPALLEPRTATELPLAVTAGDAGAATWLPPPVDDEPLVVDPEPPDEPDEEPAGATDEPPLPELPSTATELPPAVTAGDPGPVTWLPPPVDDEPLVVDPEPPAELPDEVPVEAGVPALLEPSTATELPLAVTAGDPGAATWLPPPVDDEPLVVDPEPPDEPDEELAGATDEPVLFELPSTATEFPPTATGAATEVLAWLPPRVLLAPVVL
ncbi:MAG TPA: hypothetical protein VGN48_07785, partial [Pedococcus sp.]|nr:hypothetical protein [Pedococcus sp.]